MSDVINMIMRDIEDDPSIKSHDIALDAKSKGFLRRRRFIRITGAVNSDLSVSKVEKIAQHHAGDNYDVVNELTVKKE
jgi:hypothetical protein